MVQKNQKLVVHTFSSSDPFLYSKHHHVLITVTNLSFHNETSPTIYQAIVEKSNASSVVLFENELPMCRLRLVGSRQEVMVCRFPP